MEQSSLNTSEKLLKEMVSKVVESRLKIRKVDDQSLVAATG